MISKTSILDAGLKPLQDWITAAGFPSYRAKQVMQWIFERRADSFDTMSDVPKRLRELLAQAVSYTHLTLPTTSRV